MEPPFGLELGCWGKRAACSCLIKSTSLTSQLPPQTELWGKTWSSQRPGRMCVFVQRSEKQTYFYFWFKASVLYCPAGQFDGAKKKKKVILNWNLEVVHFVRFCSQRRRWMDSISGPGHGVASVSKGPFFPVRRALSPGSACRAQSWESWHRYGPRSPAGSHAALQELHWSFISHFLQQES